ncbi:STAS domain-containing protein [Methylotenera sp. N17]|uniref:STAS domain-containing protein n=1 Tax=Methylotenera sp. N17 TaxID=1502761 RepID=UPI00064575D3|nr:STAS domain-containing protein [Methylotenera sp. N17]
MVGITQEANRWQLSGDLIIENINQVLDASKALTLSNPTQLDFTAVTDADTSAISLVLELKRRASAENMELSLTNVPANLVSLMQLYGVDDFVLPN